MRFKFLIFLAVVIGGGYWAYGHFLAPMMAAGGGAPPGMGGAAPVSVAKVIQKNVQQWHEFSGRLTSIDQVDIRPQVSGTIDSVHFQDGAVVNKGDMLFTIDPRPYEAALQSANARATLASSDLQRAKGLLADKAIPQRDYDQRKNAAAVAQADLTKAKLDLEYTKITSPITGRTGRVEITAGNLVESGPNAPVLTTVVSSNPIYADFEVDENTYLQYVHADATGNVNAAQIPVQMGLATETDTPHIGHIESFDNRLSSNSGTIRVRATFDNGNGVLVPGLFARIRLGSAATAKAILISDVAVGTDQNKKFVYVVDPKDNKVVYREVTLGQMAEGLRVVENGLSEGEEIIVNGIQRAHPGAPVTPEVVPMEDAGKPPAAAPATP
jgi:multidrug efflux system membrane fusion protein